MIRRTGRSITAGGRQAAGWVRRHAVISATAGALIAGGAGGCIGYFAFHPASATAATTTSPAPSAGPFGGGGPHRGGQGRAAVVQALIGLVAQDTGQSRDSVEATLRTGRTLGDIAGTQAASVQQQALGGLQSRLDAQVKAGRITQAQEDRRLAVRRAMLARIMSTPGTQLGTLGAGSSAA
jgi:hypothetical protein